MRYGNALNDCAVLQELHVVYKYFRSPNNLLLPREGSSNFFEKQMSQASHGFEYNAMCSNSVNTEAFCCPCNRKSRSWTIFTNCQGSTASQSLVHQPPANTLGPIPSASMPVASMPVASTAAQRSRGHGEVASTASGGHSEVAST